MPGPRSRRRSVVLTVIIGLLASLVPQAVVAAPPTMNTAVHRAEPRHPVGRGLHA